jgi:hypothetical protein
MDNLKMRGQNEQYDRLENYQANMHSDINLFAKHKVLGLSFTTSSGTGPFLYILLINVHVFFNHFPLPFSD